MRNTLTMLAILLPVTWAYAGPFGLEKGMRLDQLDVKAPMDSGTYQLNSVPKPHGEFEIYAASLSERTGVCRIAAVSHTVKNDRYGVQLRTKFESLKSQLDANYGASSLTDQLGANALYDEVGDWTMSLYKHERIYFAKWSPPSEDMKKFGLNEIRLSINGLSNDDGMITILYLFDNEPECKREISAKEADAL